MPTTDPTFGWPLPVAADPPDGPGQMAALAGGVAGSLERQYVQSVRASNASAGAGADIPVAGSAIITDALPGVYAVTVTGSAERTTTSGTRHTITLTVNGAASAAVDRDVTTSGPYNFALAELVEHTSGTLTVTCSVNTGNTAGMVRSGGRISVARVSP